MSKRLAVAGALIFYVFCGFAQKQDFQTWISAGLNGEILNAIDFEVTPELRINDNSSHIKSFLTDVELSYPLIKYLRLGTQYRFQIENGSDENDVFVNRFSLFGKVDYDIQLVKLSYRAVYEWEYSGYNSSDYGKIPLQEMRHKISIGYYKKIWPLKPSVSCEFFIPTKPEFMDLSRKIRASAGLTYKINKNMSVSLDYKFQREFYEDDPLTAHIIAANFGFSL